MQPDQDPNQDLVPDIEYAPGDERPESSIPETPESTPSDEEVHFIKLDRRNLQQEIARLEKEDPEFANTFNSYIGNKAKRKYQPQIDELHAQLEANRSELRRREILAMEDKDIDERFANDPAFAKEYAEIVHRDPNIEASITDKRRMNNALSEVMIFASDNLPEEKVKEFTKAVAEGKYDRDEDGKQFDSWVPGIMKLQRDINSTILDYRRPTSLKVDADPNPALTKPGPDTSSASVRNTRRDTSIEEYQKALRDGKTLPSDEIDRITAKYATMT